MLHEALLMLFRNRPTLAPELLREVLGVELPRWTEARVAEADLTQLTPTEYRSDLVVLLYEGKPVYGIVVEAQLARDDEKQFTLPHYCLALRAKLRIPCCLLVVTPDPATAKWASTPIDTGQPGSPFVPLVIGPGAVPVVADAEQARSRPELAVLSALAHGHEPVGLQVAMVVLGLAGGLNEERAKLYVDLVLSALNESAKRALEAMMASGNYQYQSDFAKKYYFEGEAEGVTKGKAEALAAVLLKVFAGRGLTVSDGQRARILACTDPATLDRWVDAAFQARSVEEVVG